MAKRLDVEGRLLTNVGVPLSNQLRRRHTNSSKSLKQCFLNPPCFHSIVQVFPWLPVIDRRTGSLGICTLQTWPTTDSPSWSWMMTLAEFELFALMIVKYHEAFVCISKLRVCCVVFHIHFVCMVVCVDKLSFILFYCKV